MVSGSRKRRRPDGRLASPPLAPLPLLTRNLQLLPVGLTQLPNDEVFVSRLRTDIDETLSAFSEAFLLVLTQTEHTRSIASSSTTACEPNLVPSSFSVFAQLWQRKGWHYAQFAFADHNDSKRALGHAVCRVLLEHLSPYVAECNETTDDKKGSHQIRFADLKQLLKIMAVPFGLYTFWSTQLYPDSGIGVKHCRPAMERIAIEQDYYDWLLDLPEAVLRHLKEESRTMQIAEILTADLLDVIVRLAGESSDSASDNVEKAHHLEPAFDIIPASSWGTRLPRTWPSVRVMSTLEANKELDRIGSIVRVRPGDGSTSETRERVAGLSRGDVVRLKARQRLAVASADLAKLLGPDPSESRQALPLDLLAQTTERTSGSRAHEMRVRYEIETPAWIKDAKYTAKMKACLEEDSTPMQQTLRRADASKEKYREVREMIMPPDSGADYGDWVLQSFREERRALHGNGNGDAAGRNGAEAHIAAAEESIRMDAEGTLTIDSLYRLAAERAKTAAVARGESLRRAGKSKPLPSK